MEGLISSLIASPKSTLIELSLINGVWLWLAQTYPQLGGRNRSWNILTKRKAVQRLKKCFPDPSMRQKVIDDGIQAVVTNITLMLDDSHNDIISLPDKRCCLIIGRGGSQDRYVTYHWQVNNIPSVSVNVRTIEGVIDSIYTTRDGIRDYFPSDNKNFPVRLSIPSSSHIVPDYRSSVSSDKIKSLYQRAWETGLSIIREGMFPIGTKIYLVESLCRGEDRLYLFPPKGPVVFYRDDDITAILSAIAGDIR